MCRCGKSKTKFEALLADGSTKQVSSVKEAGKWAEEKGSRLVKVEAK